MGGRSGTSVGNLQARAGTKLAFCMEKPGRMTRFGVWGRTDGRGREEEVEAEPKPNPGGPGMKF